MIIKDPITYALKIIKKQIYHSFKKQNKDFILILKESINNFYRLRSLMEKFGHYCLLQAIKFLCNDEKQNYPFVD